jgi:hypothetical protein
MKKEEIQKLKELKSGQKVAVNMFEEGGALVKRIVDVFVLYEIPEYGGEEQFVGYFPLDEFNDLIAKIDSLT